MDKGDFVKIEGDYLRTEDVCAVYLDSDRSMTIICLRSGNKFQYKSSMDDILKKIFPSTTPYR